MEQSSLSTSHALKRLLVEAPSIRKGLIVTILMVAVGTAVNLVVPILIQRIIDLEILGDTGVDVAGAIQLGGIALIGMLIAAWIRYVALLRLVTASSTGLSELRVKTFAHMHKLSSLHVEAERRGSLVSRVTSDIVAIQHFVEWGGVGLVLGVAQLIAAMIAMLFYNWNLAVIVLIGLIMYTALLVWFQKILQKLHDKMRVAVGDTLGAISETVSGLPVVRAYGAEAKAYGRVSDTVGVELRAEKHASNVGSSLFASAEVFAGAITAAVVFFGVQGGVDGGISAGTLLAMLFLVNLLVEPVQTLVETLDHAQSAGAGVRRVIEVLDTPIDIPDPESPLPLPQEALGIAFDDVTFRYPTGDDVLRNVSIAIEPGQRIAVVGETGSGKSTFAKLVTRLLDPRLGGINVGGVPLDRIAFDELRRRMVFVPQEGFLFDASVLANVRYGRPDANDEAVEQAFVDLGLSDWVAGLPDGVHTVVGERGNGLSAGERQLVALVRAWLAAPDVLVLDEATSAVDPALEVRLRRAIDALTKGRTSITVAHRLSTAEAADNVLVFDEGELVERGRHQELVALGGVYASLHMDWMAGTQT